MASIKGGGSIIAKGKDKHGVQVWEIQYSNGTKPNGARRRATRTFHGSKTEAAKKLRQLQREAEQGIEIDRSKQSFAEFANNWHNNRVSGKAITSVSAQRERDIINILCSYIGGVEIGKISPVLVDETYQRIRADKKAELGHYSETTMRRIHGKFKQIMQKATDYDLIVRNPVARVESPKLEKVNRRSLTAEEGSGLLRYVSAAEEEAYRQMKEKNDRVDSDHNGRDKPTVQLYGMREISSIIAVRIGLATGMRRGEVIGLKWSNIQLGYRDGTAFGYINVTASMDVHGNLKETKTEAGTRRLSIDTVTAESLMRWRMEQSLMFERLGLAQDNETPVCCSSKGAFLDANAFGKWWRKWRTDAGFPDLRFHELRHTQASMLLAHGVDIKTVQTRLGHAKPSITLDFYAHALPENDEKAAALVGSLFNSAPEDRPSNIVQVDVRTA